MTHFPQPNPQKRAPRLKLASAAPAMLMLEDGQRANGKLQTLSINGGLLKLSKALADGDFVELAFQTNSGMVHGMAEMLNPVDSAREGILQAFRFIALADDDHRTVRMLLDASSDLNYSAAEGVSWSSKRSS
jgi:hypothetical protein